MELRRLGVGGAREGEGEGEGENIIVTWNTSTAAAAVAAGVQHLSCCYSNTITEQMDSLLGCREVGGARSEAEATRDTRPELRVLSQLPCGVGGREGGREGGGDSGGWGG